MGVKKTLEKMMSPIRLGWHGLFVCGSAAAAAYYSDNLAVDLISGGLIFMGAECYFRSLGTFMEINESIKKHRRLNEKYVKKNLFWYCERQAIRTAAANHGLAEEFDRIKKNYKGKMMFTYIPHI